MARGGDGLASTAAGCCEERQEPWSHVVKDVTNLLKSIKQEMDIENVVM